ncbi:MAG: uridine monophosphate kinase, partial [Clostridia bacterium]
RLSNQGIELSIVIGAGNIWRGSRQCGLDIDRVRGDHMGMLATLINSIALQDYLIKSGLDTVVMSAVQMSQFCETYSQSKALEHMKNKKAVIIACGVGYPFFTTDTGMMLRAAELNVDVVLSAKAIDGVYDKDPHIYPDAVKYEKVSYDDIINKRLNVIDQTASAFGRDNNIKILLFALSDPENIYRAAMGENIGTIVT